MNTPNRPLPLSEILERLNESHIENINLYFVSRNGQKQNYSYSSYKARITTDQFQKSVYDDIYKNIANTFSNMDLVEFNPEGESPDEISFVRNQTIDEFQKIINSISGSNYEIVTSENEVLGSHCYVLVVQSNLNGQIQTTYLFKKFSHSRIFKKGGLFKISNKEFVEITDQIISLDDRIDAISVDSETYILNTNKFENIFNYVSNYTKMRTDVLSELNVKKAQVFHDPKSFELFEEHCQDGRYMKQFQKIKDFEGIDVLIAQAHELENIKNDFTLEIEVIDNKIDYKSKDSFSDMVKLLTGKFVYSALGLDPMEAIATRRR